MSKGFASSYRIVILASGLFVCFGGIGTKLVWLHVVDRDLLLKTIAKARQQTITEFARRGDIVDRNGSLLATSSSRRVLGVDPTAVRAQDQPRWPQLAAMIGMPEATLRKIFLTKFREAASPTPAPAASAPAKPAGFVFNLNASAPEGAGATADDDDTELENADDKGRRLIRWTKLADDIPESLYQDIMKLGIKGVVGDQVYRRAYPNKQLASHIIGYVNRQQEAVAGIENYADFYLHGQNGWRIGERDGRNRELPQFLDRRVPPSDGYGVTLTLDLIVQDIVEQELAYIAEKFDPLKASIVVSDPRSGFILAMANYPTFDPNEYNKVPRDEQARMKNLAVTDVYEPGSVFKIVAASAALEEGLVTPQTTFDCTLTSIEYKGRVRSLPTEAHHFSRETPVSQIVGLSSNRGAAQLAMKLGEDRFYRYARAYGFGHKLGFPVGGEVSGLLWPPAEWDGLTITRMPMGHSINCTVLQMHQAMSVLANDGVLLRPQIIREIRDAAGETVLRFGPVEVGRVVSERTAKTMALLLQGVVAKGGTAPAAAIPGYDVAGKTGTTQKLVEELDSSGNPRVDASGRPKLVYSEKHHVVSFVGFFPAGRPQVAISVIVDDADANCPGGVAAGGSVAAPSFRRIGERLIPLLNIKSDSQPADPSLVAALQGGHR